MGAYKIQHKESKKFLTTTACSRYLILYLLEYSGFDIEKAVSNNGRVFSTLTGVTKMYGRLGKFKDLFEIKELN